MPTSTASIARALLGLLLPLGALAACTESMSGPEEEPAPQLRTVYDLDVVTRYINIRGSCDEDLLGNSEPGEFQYRVEVSGGGQSHSHQSRGYNTVTGENFQRNATTDINFSNETYIWRGLTRTTGIEVTLAGAEWDGLSKDSRMANRSGTLDVPFAVGTNTRSITIGANSACQMRLYYDARWLERQVES